MRKKFDGTTRVDDDGGEAAGGDRSAIGSGFVPGQSADWRNMPGGPGLLEDNFS